MAEIHRFSSKLHAIALAHRPIKAIYIKRFVALIDQIQE